MTTQQEKSHDDGSLYCPDCGGIMPQTEPVAPAPTSSPTPEWRMLTYDSETHTWDLQDGRLFYITSGASSAIDSLEKSLRAAESLDPGLYHRLEAIVAALRGIAAGLPAEEQG